MRRALAAAGVVLALALVLAGTAVGQRRQAAAALDPLPSAENTGPAGLAAARAFLLGRGVAAPVVRAGDAPPAPGEGVVVVAAPAASLDAREADALLEHAARGGTLVLAAGRAPQPALEARLGVRLAPAPGARMAVPLAPHPLVEGLVLPVGEGQLVVTGGDALPIAGVREAVAAAALRLGRGEVLLLAGPEPFTNARLAQGGALTLLTRLAARGPVALDERWLETRTGGRPPPAALGALAGQALLAFGAYAVARGRRLGAIRPPPSDGRGRTARDYLRALAGLYRRAAAEGELARAAWARARRELERRAGIPARLPDADAALRLEARSPAGFAAFERGRTALARQPGPDALLAVVRACADLDDALRGK